MRQQFKNTINKKKGSLAIEIVIGMLIFLIALSALVDIVAIGDKFLAISSANNFLARTVEIEGGILPYTPNGFPGGSVYINTATMSQDIQQELQNAGIHNYSVTVNGVPLSQGVAVNYGDAITTTITIQYRWDLVGNFIPGMGTFSLTSRRDTLSQFAYRFGNFSSTTPITTP